MPEPENSRLPEGVEITPEEEEKAKKIAGWLSNLTKTVEHDPNMAELVLAATMRGLGEHNNHFVKHLQKLMLALDASLHLIVNDPVKMPERLREGFVNKILEVIISEEQPPSGIQTKFVEMYDPKKDLKN